MRSLFLDSVYFMGILEKFYVEILNSKFYDFFLFVLFFPFWQ
jgi:hypothetical protein